MPDSLPTTVAQGGVPPAVTPLGDAPAFRPPAVAGELGRLAGYRVQKLLGRGGMGAVYLALDEGLDRKIALKVMLPKYAADPGASERFRREARAAAAVRHDNVVTVFQVGEDCGVPFLAMELLSGYPLDAYLKRKGRLTVPQALRVGAETAAGLAAAHALGLIHRDIKPANLWLEAPQGRIKLLDFGLAKPVRAGGPADDLTNTGVAVGTPAYMAPEQARGEALDHRSDLFTLGVVLYQLATGVRPFDRPTAVASMIALATEEPVPVQARNPEVPDALARVIHALLAKAPDARPQTAAEVEQALRAIERGDLAPAAGELTVAPAASQPQVVYIPIHVTAYEPQVSEFANLADPVTDPSAERTDKELPAPGRPRAGLPVWATAGAIALVAVAVGTAAFALRKTTEGTRPEPPAPGPGATAPPPVPPRTPHETRLFAEWVIANGGSVKTADGSTFDALPKLPGGSLRITDVVLTNSAYRFANADVDRLRACPELKTLSCGDTDLTEEGFAALAALPQAAQLQVLEVPSPKATTAGVAHLGKCRGLTQLNLSRTPLAGGLKFLGDLPELKYFAASNAKLTDDDLKILKGRRLVSLNVPLNPGITAAGLDNLEGTDLQGLDISETSVPGAAAATVARYSKLVDLRVSKLGWTDADVARLRPLRLMKNLTLIGNPVTDDCLGVLEDMPNVAALVLNATGVTDAGLERLSAKKHLVDIHLRATKVTLAGVKRFQSARLEIPNLPFCEVFFNYDAKADPDRLLAEWLIAKGGTVRFTRSAKEYGAGTELPAGPLCASYLYLKWNLYAFTDADLDRLRDTSVTYYALAGHHQVTDEGMKKWAAFPNSERVVCFELANKTLTAEGYAQLARFRALKILNVPQSKVTDEALAVCRQLPKLVELDLQETPITDAGIKHLAGLKLTRVILTHTAVGDAGAEALATNTALESLNLRGTRITDAGLAHLTACKNLKELHVSATGVTAEGVRKFRAAVPNCNVVSEHPK